MLPFSEIAARARENHGGKAALARLMPAVKTAGQLRRTQDHRWLAQMARCVFQAGFVWRVVDNKWEGFEDLFFGFPPEKIILLSPEQIDRFSADPRIIRNRQKVISVQANARFVHDLSREHGSFGRFVEQWPAEDLVGLFRLLKQRGSRLGGMTGQRVLRNMGKDTFVLTADVVRCLQGAGLDIADNPTSQRELKRIQAVFNDWHAETGLPYSHLSRVSACSLPPTRQQ